VDLGGVVAVVVVLVAAWTILVAALWLHRPSRELVGPAIRLAPDVIRLVRAVMADPATPQSVRLAFGGLLVYLVNPIDLVPEFLPVIGPLDDIILAGLVLRWSARRIGVGTLRRLWPGDEAGFGLLVRIAGLHATGDA
jgi:uncharacterized membrane protein YkvA (DUF1232 family)